MRLPPPIHLEGRVPAEIAELLRSDVWKAAHCFGHGQPVMLLPGMLASDETLRLMAMWLSRQGFRPVRAGIKMNVDCSEQEMSRLSARLEGAYRQHGMPVLLIGHSRGGLFARALAMRHPRMVAGLITLGTPHLDPLRRIHPLLKMQIRLASWLGDLGIGGLAGSGCVRGGCCDDFWAELERPLPKRLPFVSIYSRSDGIVGFRSCLHPAAEHVEVHGSHCGMAVSRETYEQLIVTLRAMTGRRRARPAASPIAA
jgi:pimeloyl-ACP methyl ester carboxylesterase